MMSHNPRGAPHGNLNALKHGFYSRLLRQTDAASLPAESTGLEQEIILLRLMIRRTMLLAHGTGDLKDAVRVLDSLGAASTRLASLLKAQASLQSSRSHTAMQISQAIQQATQEIRRKP